MKPEEIKKILASDLSTMTKQEINALRKTLQAAIKWWWMTPTHELCFLGLFKVLRSMMDKEQEMLAALKK